jgi:sulfate adenylyltransferase
VLPRPHGGRLVDAYTRAERDRLLAEVFRLPRLNVNSEVASDIVNIGIGAFSPLQGFMGPDDLRSTLFAKRLPSGVPWTIPIVLISPPAGQPTRESGGPVA